MIQRLRNLSQLPPGNQKNCLMGRDDRGMRVRPVDATRRPLLPLNGADETHSKIANEKPLTDF
jgi:hypothetical protein